MNKPQFTCAKFEDGFRVSHNCNGALGFCTNDRVDEATARLIELAIDEGKRERSREINAMLRDA